MPYQIRKTPTGWGLLNLDKKIWKSYNTTKTKTNSQRDFQNILTQKNMRNNII